MSKINVVNDDIDESNFATVTICNNGVSFKFKDSQGKNSLLRIRNEDLDELVKRFVKTTTNISLYRYSEEIDSDISDDDYDSDDIMDARW